MQDNKWLSMNDVCNYLHISRDIVLHECDFLKHCRENAAIVAAIMALDRCIRNQVQPQGSVYDERGILFL